jgi:hypothetical protein
LVMGSTTTGFCGKRYATVPEPPMNRVSTLGWPTFKGSQRDGYNPAVHAPIDKVFDRKGLYDFGYGFIIEGIYWTEITPPSPDLAPKRAMRRVSIFE